MTLQLFEQRLRKYIPHVRIRQGGYADVASIYNGTQYLVRLNKGELQLYNWRDKVILTQEDLYLANHGRQLPRGGKHRGRMQALNMLVNMRFLTARQAQAVMWGL